MGVRPTLEMIGFIKMPTLYGQSILPESIMLVPSGRYDIKTLKGLETSLTADNVTASAYRVSSVFDDQLVLVLDYAV